MTTTDETPKVAKTVGEMSAEAFFQAVEALLQKYVQYLGDEERMAREREVSDRVFKDAGDLTFVSTPFRLTNEVEAFNLFQSLVGSMKARPDITFAMAIAAVPDGGGKALPVFKDGKLCLPSR